MLRGVQSLQLNNEEVDPMRGLVEPEFKRHLSAEREAHTRVKKEMAGLDSREKWPLDLAADGSLTTEKVRDRLSKLQIQGKTLARRLADTEDNLRQVSDMRLSHLDLLENPGSFYVATHDDAKRKFIAAYVSQIWLDDDGHTFVHDTQPQFMMNRVKEPSTRIGTD